MKKYLTMYHTFCPDNFVTMFPPFLTELPLEKLTVKVAELQTDLHFITSVLRRSPHLTSLHIAGLRLPSGCSQGQLLTTLSGNEWYECKCWFHQQCSDCLRPPAVFFSLLLRNSMKTLKKTTTDCCVYWSIGIRLAYFWWTLFICSWYTHWPTGPIRSHRVWVSTL